MGSDADLVVVDQEKDMTLGRQCYRGRADYSLWEGRNVKGVPVMTFLRGQLAMENGEVVRDKGFGAPCRANDEAARYLTFYAEQIG